MRNIRVLLKSCVNFYTTKFMNLHSYTFNINSKKSATGGKNAFPAVALAILAVAKGPQCRGLAFKSPLFQDEDLMFLS